MERKILNVPSWRISFKVISLRAEAYLIGNNIPHEVMIL